MPTRYKTNNSDEDDKNSKNSVGLYNDNEEEEDEADDEQRRLSESLEFPRTTLMARKSTSPIKFFLKKRLKSDSTSIGQTCILSSISNPPDSNKRKSGRQFKVPPNEIEDTTYSNTHRTSSLNKKDSISSSSLSTIDTEDNESVTTNKNQNSKRSKCESINSNEDISTLNLVKSITESFLDLNFDLTNINNKQVRHKFIDDFQSRYF